MEHWGIMKPNATACKGIYVNEISSLYVLLGLLEQLIEKLIRRNI
jgi:hypothetical protein